jgi:hypothetical protein
MSDSNERRDDWKQELECQRLAADPDLKAHCLRMAAQWSSEPDEPAKSDTEVDEGLGQG